MADRLVLSASSPFTAILKVMEEIVKAAAYKFPKPQEFAKNRVIKSKSGSMMERGNGLLGTIGVPQKFLGIRENESIRFCTVDEICTEWFEYSGSGMIVPLNLRGTELSDVTNPAIEILRMAEPLKK
jgi:hypothetical protein